MYINQNIHYWSKCATPFISFYIPIEFPFLSTTLIIIKKDIVDDENCEVYACMLGLN